MSDTPNDTTFEYAQGTYVVGIETVNGDNYALEVNDTYAIRIENQIRLPAPHDMIYFRDTRSRFTAFQRSQIKVIEIKVAKFEE